jgi:hypothetical protein
MASFVPNGAEQKRHVAYMLDDSEPSSIQEPV